MAATSMTTGTNAQRTSPVSAEICKRHNWQLFRIGIAWWRLFCTWWEGVQIRMETRWSSSYLRQTCKEWSASKSGVRSLSSRANCEHEPSISEDIIPLNQPTARRYHTLAARLGLFRICRELTEYCLNTFVGFFYLCFLVIPAMYLVMFFSGKANIEILKIGAKKRREKMCFGVICVSANVSTWQAGFVITEKCRKNSTHFSSPQGTTTPSNSLTHQ